MISLRMVGTEVSALGAAALSMPLRFVVERDRFDPPQPYQTPVVLVHGFFGDPTNFLLLRRYLAAHGMRNFAAFSYPPRLDYQRLAPRLGDLIDTICLATGAPEVDLVGHSLGGLIARYLVEMPRPSRVRRLVTLGAPYFATPLPPEELAIFAAGDPFIPPPHPIYGPHSAARQRGGRVVVVPECVHVGEGLEGVETDFVVEGPFAAWREMLDAIHGLGAADTAHSLNTLTHFGEALQVRYDDPDGHDKMYRFAESIQEFLDLSARLDFVYPDGSRPPARREALRRSGT